MTVIYALKDNLSGEYLTKADTLQRLSTTTRTFQKKEYAHKIAQDSRTYFWMAVKQWCYGQPRGYRVDVSSQEFKQYTFKLQFEHPLSVVPVDIRELLSA